MITKIQSKEIKKHIGSRHNAQISAYFIDIKFFNMFGQPYTSDYIARVVNGRVENLRVEKKVWDFVEIRKKEDQEEEERIQKLIESPDKKPSPEI